MRSQSFMALNHSENHSDREGGSDSLALLQAFFDGAASALVGIALLDTDLKFVAINHTLAEINGYTVAETLGRTVSELLPDLAPILQPVYQQVFDTGQPVVDVPITGEVPSAPGILRDWVASYIPVQGKNQQMYVGAIIVEVTRNKQLVQELEQSNQSLQRSNRDLEQFARTASHDLQEPLRTINSYAQLLERRYGDRLDERGERYLNYIAQNAQRAQNLVRDLLAYARLDAAPLTRCEVALEEVAAEVWTVFEGTGEAHFKAARLHYGNLPTVQADRNQLSQVLQNLIGNALKYCSRDRPPQITLKAQALEEFWAIRVQDNGIGIAPEYHQRIFDMFQRLHLREEYEGTGIGLAICRKIVEQHGGQIWVESIPEVGATFTFTLPR
jgi:PAS domain S-box-containing protein